MLRNASLLYELAKQLKEHRYINHSSNEILTSSQEERINDYIDDLCIDLFFRLSSFKPILITPIDTPQRFTPSGLKDIDSDYVLNLNSRFDRYTFLSILTNPHFLRNKFNRNRFIMNLYSTTKKFTATGASLVLKTGIYVHPYLAPFIKSHEYINLDYNRSAILYGFGDFINECHAVRLPNDNFTSTISDYAHIKDQEIFPGITLEYALSLYVILVEKLKLKDDNISAIIAHGFYNSEFNINHPLQLFHNYELKLDRLFRKNEVVTNDLFLRFVNSETSKAYKIEYHTPIRNIVKIQLFNTTPINDICFYNTLPLPYLHNRL
jgi:hypothetical protein